jgi:hypothetical protein
MCVILGFMMSKSVKAQGFKLLKNFWPLPYDHLLSIKYLGSLSA